MLKSWNFSKKGVDKSMVLWYYIQGSAEGTSKEVETEGSGIGWKVPILIFDF